MGYYPESWLGLVSSCARPDSRGRLSPHFSVAVQLLTILRQPFRGYAESWQLGVLCAIYAA